MESLEFYAHQAGFFEEAGIPLQSNFKKYMQADVQHFIMKVAVVFLAVLLVSAAFDLNFDDADDTVEVEDLSKCE